VVAASIVHANADELDDNEIDDNNSIIAVEDIPQQPPHAPLIVNDTEDDDDNNDDATGSGKDDDDVNVNEDEDYDDSVIGHGIGGKNIPIMARLAKGQTLE